MAAAKQAAAPTAAIPQPGTTPPAKATKAPVPATQPAPGQDGGCHAPATAGLPPPPDDAPQPKFFCAKTALTLDDLWKGQPAKFAFTVENRGEGPLQLRLKKK